MDTKAEPNIQFLRVRCVFCGESWGNMELGLRGRVAAITGGSKGIGKAIAKGLAAEGVDLLLLARGRELLEQAADEIRSATGVRVTGLRYDVSVLNAETTDSLTTNGNDGNSIYVLPQALTTSGNDSGANWKPSSLGVYGAVWKSAGGASEIAD